MTFVCLPLIFPIRKAKANLRAAPLPKRFEIRALRMEIAAATIAFAQATEMCIKSVPFVDFNDTVYLIVFATIQSCRLLYSADSSVQKRQ